MPWKKSEVVLAGSEIQALTVSYRYCAEALFLRALTEQPRSNNWLLEPGRGGTNPAQYSGSPPPHFVSPDSSQALFTLGLIHTMGFQKCFALLGFRHMLAVSPARRGYVKCQSMTMRH